MDTAIRELLQALALRLYQTNDLVFMPLTFEIQFEDNFSHKAVVEGGITDNVEDDERHMMVEFEVSHQLLVDYKKDEFFQTMFLNTITSQLAMAYRQKAGY